MTKLILFNGFLGSGKTSLIGELGRRLAARGLAVGVVTNDQAAGLVDTAYLRGLGLAAAEVAGSCFCCDFPSFMRSINELIAARRPDFILAEAVGSCTDLAATVAAPLAAFHRDLVEIGGFFVLADAAGLAGRAESLIEPRSPKAVLMRHQLAEAPFIILSKSDLLDPHALEQARAAARALNPSAELLACSIVNGDGLDGLEARLLAGAPMAEPVRVPLDYEVYAAAEAAFGWYNGGFTVAAAAAGFEPSELAARLLSGLAGPALGEIAHAKLHLLTPAGSMKMSLASGRLRPDGYAPGPVAKAELILNVRAEGTPEAVAEAARLSIEAAAAGLGLTVSGYSFGALAPAPPRPTYRM